MKYIEKQRIVEALQLSWETWHAMCEFAQVGNLEDGRPEGCYVNKNNEHVDSYPGPDALLGMRVPTDAGVSLARQGDMIVKYPSGMLDVFTTHDFYRKYELRWGDSKPRHGREPYQDPAGSDNQPRPPSYHGPFLDVSKETPK